MKIETIVWMVFVLIGVALAGGFGALLVGVLWVGYALGIARATMHVERRERPTDASAPAHRGED
jgi:hypothetical protein